ncbi:MATE family efflux transporter [Bacillus solitudinis]|uniref:hypothetical protein n=1 Tax=Bacillus solitudinis TaxID=2014074 RepID=UPI000C244173|nr:hypothetical protein [Bacillus solitudinis]
MHFFKPDPAINGFLDSRRQAQRAEPVLLFGALGFPKLGVIGVAISTAVSQLVGLSNLFRSILVTLFAVFFLSLFRVPLVELFIKSPEIILIASTLLFVRLFVRTSKKLSLQAVVDARYAMVSSVLIMWLFSVPLTYFLCIHLGYGLYGIFAAFIIDEWARGLAF